MDIRFSPEILQAAPGLQVIALEAEVVNTPTPDALWSEIVEAGEWIRSNYALSDINSRPAIAGTRRAYKALGKDPNRYRPSADALCRRLAKSMELYRIDSLVDVINLLSIRSGYSIGGFDADKIQGDTLTLGRGQAGEPFEAIGRGMLNIEGLPVYRDEAGGIGTPTSDNERTKISLDTRRLLMIVNMYHIEMSPDDTVALATRLLNEYCQGTNITFRLIRAQN